MRSIFFVFFCVFFLSSCREEKIPAPPALTLTAPQKISAIDKDYKRLARNKSLVQIKGKITHQSKTAPDWVFIEDDTAVALIDFAKLPLPPKQIEKTLTVEGYVSPDETVINEYSIAPVSYKLEI